MPDGSAGSLRVLVDGRCLGDASAFRGMGGYARSVVAAMGALPGIDVTALVTPATELPPGVARATMLRGGPGRFQDGQHRLMLSLDVLRYPSEVLWLPANVPPSRCRRPWVQTLHDLGAADSSDAGVQQRFRRDVERYRRATHIITGSAWSAGDIVDRVGVPMSRVTVIHHGVAPRFRPGSSSQLEAEPYVLFVAEYDPRKRHDHAFAAIAATVGEGLPHRLRVVGRIAPWFADRLDELRAASGVPERIELLGYVDDETLVELYQGAAAVLVTSEMEGFGLPVVEAMACGAPVIAYANTAITEVVAAAGVLVDDGDCAALGRALVALLRDRVMAGELTEAGLERAADFSWERSGRQHAEVFRSVVG